MNGFGIIIIEDDGLGVPVSSKYMGANGKTPMSVDDLACFKKATILQMGSAFVVSMSILMSM